MESTISSITIKKLLPEIEEEIEDKYLNKVQQLDENTYRFRFSPGSKDLIIEPGKRTNITRFRLKAPKKPSQASMILRKHLSNSKLKEIKQINFDRVVEMSFDRGNKVIVELFGEGNLVLTDEDYEIVYVHKSGEWKHRTLRRGKEYKYPPSKLLNPFEADLDEFKEFLTEKSIVVDLASNLGLGGDIAEEICQEAEIKKKKEELTDEEIKKVYNIMKKVLNREKEPVKQGKKIRPFPLNGEFEEGYESINQAIDENYTDREKEEKKDGEMEKLKKRLKHQKESINKFEDKIEENQRKGDLVYRKYDEIAKAVQLFKEEKKEELEGMDVEIKGRKLVFDFDD